MFVKVYRRGQDGEGEATFDCSGISIEQGWPDGPDGPQRDMLLSLKAEDGSEMQSIRLKSAEWPYAGVYLMSASGKTIDHIGWNYQ